ncbi:MAG: hypothetical protein WCD37_07520 [Chloroflexia bacterium]
MLEDKVKLVSENFARTMDRRGFIRKTGATAFAGMIALATGHLFAGKTEAGSHVRIPRVPQCSPPGPFCNLNGVNEPNGCLGARPGGPYNARCFQHMQDGEVLQCRVYYKYYSSGCWTYASGGGYWTCCDCECGTPILATCGCAGWSLEPVPDPDRPA